jgi:hypothetical protein
MESEKPEWLHAPPWLTNEELDDLCKPLTQAAAQIRFLRSLGLTVKTKPNGTPLVMRSHFEQVMNPAGNQNPKERPQPNRAAYLAHIGKKKGPAGGA